MEQVGLWEGCVGSSGNVSCAVWEKVGLWKGCVETSANVNCAVWEQVELWEGCVVKRGNVSCGNESNTVWITSGILGRLCGN